MDREELIQELRVILDDVGYDPGWTDPVLVRALSEGQDRFCERSGFFVDDSTYTVETVAGTAGYVLSPRIITVLDVFDASGRLLGKYQRGDVYPETPPGRPYPDVGSNQAAPSSWQTDASGRRLTLYPTPAEIQTITLKVWRRSEFAFSDDMEEPELEIPEEFHFAPIEWAAYKLLRHHDMEKENKIKSTEHLMAFNDYVSDGKQAHRRIMGDVYRISGNPLYVI